MIDYNITKEQLDLIIKNINIDFEKTIDSNERKATGSFYTGFELSCFMMNEMFSTFSEKYIKNISNKLFLEPCVGIGSFVFAYLKCISNLNLSKKEVLKVLNNIYVCDINENAIMEYKKIFRQFVYTYFKIELEENFFDGKIANGLLYNMNNDNFKYIDINNIFSDVMKNGGFDIVVTNPPYKNLKAEKNKYIDEEKYLNNKNLFEKVSEYSKKMFKYSSEGIINLYKLFVEEIVCKYSKKDAVISLLVPNTILTDKTCEKLRTYLLNTHKITHINVLKENNEYINAQQSLCSILMKKDEKTDIIKINNDFCNNKNHYSDVNIDNILNAENGNSIFTLTEKEYNLLFQLQSFPKIKDLEFIVNKRGECDLTLNKQYISNFVSEYKLVRGRNIGYYNFDENSINEYVNKDFLNDNKLKYISQERIACQQIANINKERRISYTKIPPNCVLGNSCNFIYVNDNNYNIDIYYMLGLLNSDIINWYFKLISSNNHVNNYEIDLFPVPIDDSKNIQNISSYVKKYLKNGDTENLEKINNLVYEMIFNDKEQEIEEIKEDFLIDKLYKDIIKIIPIFPKQSVSEILADKISTEATIASLNLKLSKFDEKVIKGLFEKYKKIKNNEILNHITFKLSDLDLEMIKSVPMGGNWQNIPEETVKKSQRLTKITKTGGRTTLYGRIDYNKPSYTITTYFNRPGNGTYVHPKFDRVISVREAARFQSFKDDYYFYGSKTELLNQVGNAVPCILAREIGKKVAETGFIKSLDLFCGAGGMTAGFKDAGITSAVANDFNESACVTFKINNPEVDVICDDITKQEVKDRIIDIAKSKSVDMICGGPPCQGFSYAGKRFIDDPRNQLFKDFIDIVQSVQPKVVVMENVEGILTFDKGNVYKQIHELYKNLGYEIEGRVLMASDYGVPQKRKRVIIICVKKELNIMPETLFPEKVTDTESKQITALEAIGDLECVQCNHNAQYSNEKISNYVSELKSFLKK